MLACLLAAGLVLRLLWLSLVHGGPRLFADAGEAASIALAFARSGVLGDAYFAGQGPTAHVMPVSPLAAGIILRLSGPESAAAPVLLLVWSLAQWGAALLLLAQLFGRLGLPTRLVRGGFALLCLVPVFVSQEIIDFQFWESGLALALAAGSLSLLVRVSATGIRRRADIVAPAAVTAAALFVSPPAGLAAGLCWAVFALRSLPLRTTLALAGWGLCFLSLAIVPWVIRNERAMGAIVPLRSNAGLELAIANHPAALSSPDPEAAFVHRISAIHPIANPALRPLIGMRAGEVAYARALGRRTGRWMADNPAAVSRLYFRHVRDFLFPPAWQLGLSGWGEWRRTRAIAITLVSLAGLVGLARLVRREATLFWVPAVFAAGIILPYGLFQPTARYVYLTHGIFVFAAMALWWRPDGAGAPSGARQV